MIDVKEEIHMNDADRKLIKQACIDAVKNSPHADTPILGLGTADGRQATLRTIFMSSIENEMFYKNIERSIEQGKTTLTQEIERLRNTRKIVAP